MAKKVRRRAEEEVATFEFPEFDEATFLSKEFELAGALWLTVGITVAMGLLSWLATWLGGLPWYVPFALGMVFLVVSPWLIGRLRPNSGRYTKGDWAALLAFEFFGWLALWFVLVNVT